MLLKIVGLFAFIALANAQRQVLMVYYESLCPDSQQFITTQLYPALTGPNSLAKYIETRLVPYGKSTYQTQGADVIFQCHHGPNECYGNKVQSCAIQHIQVNSYQRDNNRESLILEYINCLMSAGKNFNDQIYPVEKCARQTKVDNWDVIGQCANSTDGSKFLQSNGQTTMNLQPALTSVPTITFGQQFDQEFQTEGVKNLRRALCNKISPRPRECSGADNGAAEKTTAAALVTFVTFLIVRFF